MMDRANCKNCFPHFFVRELLYNALQKGGETACTGTKPLALIFEKIGNLAQHVGFMSQKSL